MCYYIFVCVLSYYMILLPKEYYRYTLYVIGMSRGVYGTFLETAVGSSAPATGNHSLQNTMQYLLKKKLLKKQFLIQTYFYIIPFLFHIQDDYYNYYYDDYYYYNDYYYDDSYDYGEGSDAGMNLIIFETYIDCVLDSTYSNISL